MALSSSKAVEEDRTIVFVDEAGFYPLPFVARTYTRCGQTPVLQALVTHDHLSVICGVTTEGRLFTYIKEKAFTRQTVVGFVQKLLRQIRGKVPVVWDGATIQRCQAVKDYLAGGAAARLQLERLPGYAPELNPDEWVWSLLKRRELKNRCCQTLHHLR